MRLARFRADGHTAWGTLDGDQVVVIPDPLAPESCEPGREARLAAASPAPTQRLHPGAAFALADVELLPPATPGAVLGMAHNTGPEDRKLPPQAFLKNPRVTGAGAAIPVPHTIGQVDAEAELAVVIGKPARWLQPADALDHVLGYTLGNDVTARALQATDPLWTTAKARDGWTPLGPWLITDIDPDAITLGLRVDGRDLQPASTTGLARSVAETLVYITSFMTLYPGDVVLTGAPGQVSPIHDGETVTVHADAFGELSNPVVLDPERTRIAA